MIQRLHASLENVPPMDAEGCTQLGTDAYISTGRKKHTATAIGDPSTCCDGDDARARMRRKLQTAASGASCFEACLLSRVNGRWSVRATIC